MLDNLCFWLNDPVLYINGKSNLNFGAIGVMDEVWGNMNFNNVSECGKVHHLSNTFISTVILIETNCIRKLRREINVE